MHTILGILIVIILIFIYYCAACEHFESRREKAAASVDWVHNQGGISQSKFADYKRDIGGNIVEYEKTREYIRKGKKDLASLDNFMVI